MKVHSIIITTLILASCSKNDSLRYLEEGNAHVEREDFYKAEIAYTKAIAKQSDNKEAYFKRGELRIKTKDFGGSFKDFTKALSLDSNYKQAWLRYGNALHQSGEFKKALKCYDKAILLDNKNEIAYVNRGVLLFALKQYQRAIDDYTQAIAFNPTKTNYYLNRAQCYEKLGRTDLNILDLQKILDLEPQSKVSKHNLAFSYSTNKQYAKADSLFAPLYAQNPTDPFILNNYGFVRFKLGDVKKGKALIEESLKIKPDNAYAYRNSVIILLAERNIEKACQYIDLGLQRGFTQEYGSELEDLKIRHCR